MKILTKHFLNEWLNPMIMPNGSRLHQPPKLRSFVCLSACFCWSIVDLQCCVNFCSTAKWFSYTYIYILFFNWRIIHLQCCLAFCCTSIWISCKFTYISSLVSLPPINLFHILFHYDLLQDIDDSSLCYPAGPCCFGRTLLTLWTLIM